MKFNRLAKIGAITAAAALLLSGCAANEGSQNSAEPSTSTISGTFAGAGASAQEAAQASWITEFQKAHNGVTINYNPVGSGDGRKQFINGATVYAGSDSYLKDDELAGNFAICAPDTKAIDLPVYISPIAVIFNIEGVDELNVDAELLAKIFKGEIRNWNDAAVAALNPNATLPDAEITVVHRSDSSGTTENFTDYIAANAPAAWGEEPSDDFPFSFRGAEGAKGTSGVVSAVENGVNTIGYADASKAGSLATAALKVGDEFVNFTPEAAAKVVDASPVVPGREVNDLAIELDRTTTEAGAYPLVLISYLIVCEQYANAKDAEFVKAFASYIASPEGQAAAQAGAGSAPISAATAAKVQASIDSIK